MMFKYETSKFSKHLLYISSDLNAGKVERMVQLQFCVLYTISLSYEVDEIDWGLQCSWFSS